MKLSAFGKDFDLTLEPNDDVINDGRLSVERRTADGLLTKEIHLPQGRFYVGHVASDPNSHVAVREADEKGQLVRLLNYQTVRKFLKPNEKEVSRGSSLGEDTVLS